MSQFSPIFKILNRNVANYSKTPYANNHVLKKRSQNTLSTNACAIEDVKWRKYYLRLIRYVISLMLTISIRFLDCLFTR